MGSNVLAHSVFVGGPSLASQTNDATATAGDIVAGKTAYVKGNKVVGTLVPNNKKWAVGVTSSESVDVGFAPTHVYGYATDSKKETYGVSGEFAVVFVGDTAYSLYTKSSSHYRVYFDEEYSRFSLKTYGFHLTAPSLTTWYSYYCAVGE